MNLPYPLALRGPIHSQQPVPSSGRSTCAQNRATASGLNGFASFFMPVA